MNAPRGGGGNKPSASTSKANKNSNRNNNRTRRSRNKQNRNKGNSRRPRGPPQSPQAKVTFRNIGNTELYGTVEGIANIIRAVVEKANERLTGPADKKILLDEESLVKLIENDKLTAQAIENWKTKQKTEEQEAEQQPEENVQAEKKTEDDTSAIVSGMKELEIKDKGDKIFARPLYAVPPKKTRRRGEKPGNAYLVMTTPSIQAIELPPPPVEEGAVEGAENATQADEKTTEVPPAPPKLDYSRQIAERQLALVRAIEVMTTIADEDTKGDQVWAGCQVEESKNGKSWRAPQRKDHRDGTVKESPGFKAFMEMMAKEKEDLQARPKPTPGGGLTAFSTGLPASEDGKPVAALVLHLKNKREQEKAQKKNKRKTKDAKKKATTGTENHTNGKAEGTGAAKKKGRSRKNKKNAANKKAEPKP